MSDRPIEAIREIVQNTTVPEQHVNRGDHIMWRQEGPTPRDWGANKACFGGSMSNHVLTGHTFECRSFEKGKHLPQKVYLGTMRQLCLVGLIAPGIRYWFDSQHTRLKIPANKYDRHTVYTALSLYRHCDRQPYTMYLAWRLFRRLRDYKIPYLQCLHYTLGQLGYYGHTFMTMSSYGSLSGPQNPAYGWALAHFGALSFAERAELQPPNFTTTMFAKLATLPNPGRPQKTEYTLGFGGSMTIEPGTKNLPYYVTAPVDILDPQLTPLYTDPESYKEPKNFAGLVENLCPAPTSVSRDGRPAPWVRKIAKVIPK